MISATINANDAMCGCIPSSMLAIEILDIPNQNLRTNYFEKTVEI